MKQSYEAIIVGAGISGLTLANYLAQYGVETVLIEQSGHVGGYVSSFQRERYRFDAGLTSFGSNGIVMPILRELGLADRVTLIPATRRLITDQFQTRVDESLQPLAGELMRVFPHEREGIERYFHWLEEMKQGFRSLFESQILLGRWHGTVPGLMKLALREIPFLRSFLRIRRQTKQEIHRQYFRDPALRAFFDHQGYPVMTAMVLAGMWYSFTEDYWYPLGGMQHFSDMLREAYTRRGGETALHTKVEGLIMRDGKAVGVRLQDGREVWGGGIFVNTDLRRTYLDWLGGEYGGQAFIGKLRQAQPSESAFSLFLGLKGKGFPRSPYPLDVLHQHFQITGEDGCKWEFAVNIPTQVDPDQVFDGESVIVTCFEEYDDWFSAGNRGGGYLQRKAARVRRMMPVLEKVFPDLRERLEVLDAASPLTFERHTGNYKGATAGWSWNPCVQPRFHWRREGHVPGLYCGGQWLQNPGGVPTAMLTARWAAESFRKKLSDFGGN